VRLRPSTRAALSDLIAEWVHRRELAARKIERRTKLLFHGPPGCGKSVTARALGLELRLPVYVVRFDAVVGAYLGQTALHLRQLFRFAETTPSVILIDEIDALGKRRGSPLDVGELDRVVIALLQELEHSKPAGLLIATSNLAKQLDDALWRRFDLVVDFPRPTARDLLAFSADVARSKGLKLSTQLRAALARTKTFADAERAVEAEERRQVLKGR
jgi:SpoVK/Ycf46/Vps4 family AAA+-type ATPase